MFDFIFKTLLFHWHGEELLSLAAIITGRSGLKRRCRCGGRGAIPGPIKSDTVVNSSPSLRCFCVAQAPSRGSGPRHSLHAST